VVTVAGRSDVDEAAWAAFRFALAIMAALLFLIWALTRILGGTAHAGGPDGKQRLPPQLLRAMALADPRTGEPVGWCGPDTLTTCLSADHLVRAGFFLQAYECRQWDDCREDSPRVIRVITRDGQRDQATFVVQAEDVASTRTWAPIRYARRLPALQERLCWRAFLTGPRPVPTAFCGTYVGRDSLGHLVVDGAIERGASGSPVLDEAGEIVGVVSASDNPSEGWHPHPFALGAQEAVQLLQMQSNFRALGLITPAIGGPKR
jgi:hypothetical protein